MQGRRQGVWLGVAKCFDAAPPSQKECATSPEKGRSGGGGRGERGSTTTLFSRFKKKKGKIYIMG